jgi:hypothetical protein
MSKGKTYLKYIPKDEIKKLDEKLVTYCDSHNYINKIRTDLSKTKPNEFDEFFKQVKFLPLIIKEAKELAGKVIEILSSKAEIAKQKGEYREAIDIYNACIDFVDNKYIGKLAKNGKIIKEKMAHNIDRTIKAPERIQQQLNLQIDAELELFNANYSKYKELLNGHHDRVEKLAKTFDEKRKSNPDKILLEIIEKANETIYNNLYNKLENQSLKEHYNTLVTIIDKHKTVIAPKKWLIDKPLEIRTKGFREITNELRASLSDNSLNI